VDVPAISEQREIAAILGALDDKIEVNRKASATLEEMARALYRSWFVDFDPVWAKLEGRQPAHMDAATAALFPDSFDNDGLPRGWHFSPMGAVSGQLKQSVKPMDAPNAAFWHYSLPAFDAGASPILENGAAIKSNKLFVPNDAILFSRLNPSTPRVWWARSDIASATPTASTEFYVAIASCLEDTPWLYCLLSSPEFLEQACSRVTGTSNSHQAAFSGMTSSWFEKIHAMKAESRTLATVRDTLLQRLMSGELRVGEARELVGEVA
jgi:type I restriction enzyme S subunit